MKKSPPGLHKKEKENVLITARLSKPFFPLKAFISMKQSFLLGVEVSFGSSTGMFYGFGAASENLAYRHVELQVLGLMVRQADRRATPTGSAPRNKSAHFQLCRAYWICFRTQPSRTSN